MYKSKTKRLITVVLCAIMILCMMQPAGTANAAMAKEGSKWVGNIIAGNTPSNFGTYWNQVTPENGSKWGSVEGSRDNMNWGNADMIYNYAKNNGIPFKFHTLVWGSQYPNWITSLSASDQKAEVLEWIQAAGKKYPNSEYVDVVNEPLHSPAPFRDAIGGAGSTGWDWIVWSFEQARQAFPNSKLLINDYGIIADPNAANRYVQIINILKNKGLVDGIGIQCHQFNMDNVSVSTMKQVLGILGATGLPIYVSELDITGDDTTQYNRYKEKFPVLYESQYVKGITLWGYIQGQTWVNNTHIISTSGVERPALTWLKQYLANASAGPTNTPTQKSSPTPTQGVSPSNPADSTGDLNNDGAINMLDVMLLAGSFNSVRGDSRYVAAYDLNNDGAINMSDVMVIAGKFNTVVNKTNTPTNTPKPSPTNTPNPSPSAAKFHCFLLLGQSNMAGYAKTQPADKVEDPRVLVLGYDNNPALGRVTDQWDVACPPLHPAWLDAIGPGDWFGKTMIEKVPNDKIGLIPCAISGEKIETFMKSGGAKYSWIINRAKIAQQSGGVIEGIIFHQGESNSGDPSWPGKVKTLVEDLRKDLNLGNVPFLPGELLYSGPCAGHNTLVNQLPSLISNCYVISAQGLVVDPSDTTYRLHFGHDSSVTLGKRYAEKMIQVLGW